jgi:uncharacterized protein HemY
MIKKINDEEKLITLGIEFYNEKKFDKAKVVFEKARKINEKNIKTLIIIKIKDIVGLKK